MKNKSGEEANQQGFWSVCMLLYMLNSDYQNTYFTGKVRTFLGI